VTGISESVDNPCDDRYRGPQPFSETEIISATDFLLTHNRQESI
jgi:hypothetical protein